MTNKYIVKLLILGLLIWMLLHALSLHFFPGLSRFVLFKYSVFWTIVITLIIGYFLRPKGERQ